MTGLFHNIVGGNPNASSGTGEIMSPQEHSSAGTKTQHGNHPADLPLPFLKGDESTPGIICFELDGYIIRIVQQDGNTWFVAPDLVRAIDGVWEDNSSIMPVPADFRRIIPIVVPPGAQNVSVLSVAGVVHFFNTSSSPSAFSMFKRVICELLPSLRWSRPESAKPARSYGTLAALSREPITRFAADANNLAMEIKLLSAEAIWADNQLTKLMASLRLYNPPVPITVNKNLDEVAERLLGVDLDGLLETLRRMKVLCSGSGGHWTERNSPYSTFTHGSKPYFDFRMASTNTKPDGTVGQEDIPIVTPLGLKWLFSRLWDGQFNANLK